MSCSLRSDGRASSKINCCGPRAATASRARSDSKGRRWLRLPAAMAINSTDHPGSQWDLGRKLRPRAAERPDLTRCHRDYLDDVRRRWDASVDAVESRMRPHSLPASDSTTG